MDNLLKIKDLVLNKAIIDLKTYQKIIDRYLKTKDQAVGPYEPLPGIKNTLKPLSINPDYLKLPNQQRLFHEEVFILNILEKASSLGLKSLTQSEISLFQDIIAHRKAQMESVDREIEELIAWLKTQPKPDVLCLSNALLIGLARRLKADLGIL